MRIGQIADRTDLSVQTIRFYERKGLLTKVPRDDSGYRNFSPEDVRRIQFIRHSQDVGFTLNEISDLLSLRVAENGSCESVREFACDKVEQLDERLESLRKMRKTLMDLVALCDDGLPASSCPILDALENDD